MIFQQIIFIRIGESRINYSILALVRSHRHFYAISTWLDLSSRSSVRVITGIINYICPLVSSTPSIHVSYLSLLLSSLVRAVDESMKKYRIRCSSVSHLSKSRHEEQKEVIANRNDALRIS